MTMKTPQQITDEILDRNYGHLDPEGNFADGLSRALANGDVDYHGIRAMIEAAIEADRAQPRFLLISEHDDSGVIAMYESREAAIEAAIANCDNDPDIWDEYYSIQEV